MPFIQAENEQKKEHWGSLHHFISRHDCIYLERYILKEMEELSLSFGADYKTSNILSF